MLISRRAALRPVRPPAPGRGFLRPALLCRQNGASGKRDETTPPRRPHWRLLVLLFGNPAFAQHRPHQKPAGGTLTIDLAEMQKPWTGDLDGMIERRVIRVLTVNSKTFYFHRQGRPARHRRRLRPAVRGRAQQEARRRKEAQEQEPEGAGGLHSGAARPTAAGACRRQGRHRRRQSHDHAGAPEAGGLHRGRPEQRERGRGVGPGFTEDRQPGRSFRQGSVRAQVVELLREPRRAQQEVCGGKETAGHAQGSPRDAGGRGPARDAQRRPHSAHRRRQAHRGLLEADLPAAHRARQRRGSHRRRDRVGDPQGQPAAQGGGWTISRRATRSGPRPATSS